MRALTTTRLEPGEKVWLDTRTGALPPRPKRGPLVFRGRSCSAPAFPAWSRTMREKRTFPERTLSLGGLRRGSNGCFMYFAALLLPAAIVYGNERGSPIRKPVNCRDVLKHGKSAFIRRDRKRSAHRFALGMDARGAETEAGSACDSPARGYARTPKPESGRATGHMREKVRITGRGTENTV